VVPGKGYDLLIAAVATIADLPWRLTIAGDRTRNLAAAARLDADISAHGLDDRVAVLGAVPPERIIELYLASDVFVLASRFEGYGMARKALVVAVEMVNYYAILKKELNRTGTADEADDSSNATDMP
jgi:glycosyltransferase involved in cell wall biosynthesis